MSAPVFAPLRVLTRAEIARRRQPTWGQAIAERVAHEDACPWWLSDAPCVECKRVADAEWEAYRRHMDGGPS